MLKNVEHVKNTKTLSLAFEADTKLCTYRYHHLKRSLSAARRTGRVPSRRTQICIPVDHRSRPAPPCPAPPSPAPASTVIFVVHKVISTKQRTRKWSYTTYRILSEVLDGEGLVAVDFIRIDLLLSLGMVHYLIQYANGISGPTSRSSRLSLAAPASGLLWRSPLACSLGTSTRSVLEATRPTHAAP